MVKAIVIGNGSIGSELKRQIQAMKEQGWVLGCVFDIDKILDADGKAIDEIGNWQKYEGDIVFLAIPTDTGEKAFLYIEHFASRGIPVVTCEKGALAYRFKELMQYMLGGKLGYAAAVGGGTRMLPYLEGRMSANAFSNSPNAIDSILGVLNGTLNYIFTRLAEGMDQEAVLKEVLEKKYAEPGAVTFETIIAGETGDLHKKGVILANISRLIEELFVPNKPFVIDPKNLSSSINNPKEHRFLATLNKEKLSDFLDGVEYEQNGWHLQIGIFKTTELGKTFVLPEAVNNALYIKEGESVFSVTGPGAGPKPTARAMIIDALNLLKK